MLLPVLDMSKMKISLGWTCGSTVRETVSPRLSMAQLSKSKPGPRLAMVDRAKALTEVQTRWGSVLVMASVFEWTEKLHLILVVLVCVGMAIVMEMTPPSSFKFKGNADEEAEEAKKDVDRDKG
ncbi:hypothetical protein AHAS_Ahas09G0197200 [Arachis hypogaea]